MQHMSNAIRLFAVILFALIGSGCATTTLELSDADRAKFDSVKINDTVDKVAAPYLLAPGGSAGLMFGVVGGLAVSGKIEGDQQSFAAFLNKNSISIEKIAKEEIELALRESKKFKVAETNSPPMPELKISVKQYGFSVPHLLSTNVVPLVYIECNLIDPAGTIIWRAGERLMTLGNPVDSINWQTLRDNPKLIEEQWRKASRYLAQKIVQQL